MDVTKRQAELEGLLTASDEQLAGLRDRMDRVAQERLLLVGALLEIRRLVDSERQDTAERPIEEISPGGTE